MYFAFPKFKNFFILYFLNTIHFIRNSLIVWVVGLLYFRWTDS